MRCEFETAPAGGLERIGAKRGHVDAKLRERRGCHFGGLPGANVALHILRQKSQALLVAIKRFRPEKRIKKRKGGEKFRVPSPRWSWALAWR